MMLSNFENIAYAMTGFVGLQLLLVEYGIIPSKSVVKKYKPSRVKKVMWYALLIYSILNLLLNNL
jgi:hypothetical protein